MHDLLGRLPHRIKVQFVITCIRSSGDSSSFSDLRNLAEKAASEANSEYGRVLYKSRQFEGTRPCY